MRDSETKNVSEVKRGPKFREGLDLLERPPPPGEFGGSYVSGSHFKFFLTLLKLTLAVSEISHICEITLQTIAALYDTNQAQLKKYTEMSQNSTFF